MGNMKPGMRSDKFSSFVALPRAMLKNVEWRAGLSSSAKVLYIHIKGKFVGYNNGEICLHYSELRGVMAPATASRAFKELEEKEWIVRERQIGGRYRFTVLYKLTGKYDECIHKFKF